MFKKKSWDNFKWVEKIIRKLTNGIMLYSWDLFHIRKKIIFQLLVRNKEPFIKLKTALNGHLSLNTKHLLFQMFFLRQMTTKRALKKNQVVVDQKTYNKRAIYHVYLHNIPSSIIVLTYKCYTWQVITADVSYAICIFTFLIIISLRL